MSENPTRGATRMCESPWFARGGWSGLELTDTLERMLKLSEFRGIHIWEATEVLLLMYADDIVLVGEIIIKAPKENSVESMA